MTVTEMEIFHNVMHATTAHFFVKSPFKRKIKGDFMKNSNNVKVYFSFLNRKNELKTVHFLIDKQSYKVLKQFPKEERDKYMLEEYRLFCKEQKHKRKTQSINSFFDNEDNITLFSLFTLSIIIPPN